MKPPSRLPPPSEGHGFIGERRDTDAGLIYLNARYYDPELGLFAQPDWFEVTEAGVGTNRYAYSFNDPVNGLDPYGNLVMLVDGTNSEGGWRTDDPDDPDDLFSQVERQYGETPKALDNLDMGNERTERTGPAERLAQAIRNAIANGDEQIVIIAPSHGVNVVKEASWMTGVQIDQIIGLGGPVRDDYTMNMDVVTSYINVFSEYDAVQLYGGTDGNVAAARAAGVSALRRDPKATINFESSYIRTVDKGGVPNLERVGHFMWPSIHGPEVWVQNIAPLLK